MWGRTVRARVSEQIHGASAIPLLHGPGNCGPRGHVTCRDDPGSEQQVWAKPACLASPPTPERFISTWHSAPSSSPPWPGLQTGPRSTAESRESQNQATRGDGERNSASPIHPLTPSSQACLRPPSAGASRATSRRALPHPHSSRPDDLRRMEHERSCNTPQIKDVEE